MAEQNLKLHGVESNPDNELKQETESESVLHQEIVLTKSPSPPPLSPAQSPPQLSVIDVARTKPVNMSATENESFTVSGIASGKQYSGSKQDTTHVRANGLPCMRVFAPSAPGLPATTLHLLPSKRFVDNMLTISNTKQPTEHISSGNLRNTFVKRPVLQKDKVQVEHVLNELSKCVIAFTHLLNNQEFYNR